MKKNLKPVTLILILTMILALVAGCTGQTTTTTTATTTASGETTATTTTTAAASGASITFLNSKGEITSQLEDAAKAFTAETGIELEIIPCPAGTSPFETASAMYNSGSAPSILMVDPNDVPKFVDKVLDLSAESWTKLAMSGALTAGTVNGKVLAMPLTVEGYGIIVNNKTVSKAIGSTFDPKSIQTYDNLKDLFAKITAGGVAPVKICQENWSLGAHLFSQVYINQSSDPAKVQAFVDGLKTGTVKLMDNKVFNDFMTTFDLMIANNVGKADPLNYRYEEEPLLLTSGKAAMWYQGNWTWPNFVDSAQADDLDYGFLPLVLGNDPNAYGNSQIIAGVSKEMMIDKEQNSAEQQAAAKTFLNWLVTSDSGQKAIAVNMKLIPAFSGFAYKPEDPLARSILSYLEAGKTMPTIATLPADHWEKIGGILQKYLADQSAGKGDHAVLAKQIEDYWKSVS